MESNLMNAYQDAYKIACESLKNCDFEEISLNTNAVYNKLDNYISLKYLNDIYIIDCVSGNVVMKNCDKEVSTTIKVLILHYLLKSKIKPLSGKFISFKEIPAGGAIYYQTFYKRAITPLIDAFANNLEGFYNAAFRLNGLRESYGHASVTINIFPLVPVTYIIWQGDEEVPASGTILFDNTVTDYLPVEDIVLAASYGVYELIKRVKSI
jgi:hypothetical protein